MAIAHLALNLGLRCQCGHRVNHDHVNRARAHQHVRDFQRLLTSVRLGHQQVVRVHAKLARVVRVERVLRVDKRGDAAAALCLRDRVQRHGGLTRRLRPVDLHDSSARPTTDAERDIDGGVAGRDGLDRRAVLIAQAHDSALAVVLLNHCQRCIERILAVIAGRSRGLLLRCHVVFLPPSIRRRWARRVHSFLVRRIAIPLRFHSTRRNLSQAENTAHCRTRRRHAREYTQTCSKFKDTPGWRSRR